MTDWGAFPTRPIDTTTTLYRIHQRHLHPAWFSTDGSLRFDPPPSHRDRFGVCYLGLDPLAAYVEVFGRIRAVPQAEFDRRRLSQLTISRVAHVADLTQRAVLGTFGITAAHSMGTDYTPAQQLSSILFNAGFDGVVHRVESAMILLCGLRGWLSLANPARRLVGSMPRRPVPSRMD